MKNLTLRIEDKIRIYLSHHPRLYALIVGAGIVLFWRGIWHTTDAFHSYFSSFQNSATIGLSSPVWWDGPLSLFAGAVILLLTGAFTSSFIGNELILSGLREEKRLTQKTESEVKTEEEFIFDIKQELRTMSEKIEQLEKEVRRKGIK
jgi:predicted phage tail protein